MRLRERLAQDGADTMSDSELVALLLGTGMKGRSALAVASELVDSLGGAAGMLRAEPSQLASIPGVGPVRALQLHAALMLGRRAQRPPLHQGIPVIRSVSDAIAQLAPNLRGREDEALHALYLDRRRRVLARRELTRGSDAFTVVDPRQIFRYAVRTGASAVVLAHNHPSGDPEPSVQDEEVTKRVAKAGHVIGVVLLDHLVIGGAQTTSFAERGLLAPWETPLPVWTA